MTVSADYLTKLRRAVRRNSGTDVDAELTDIIEECRIDLQSLGVIPSKTTDETDRLILGAIRCYVRWKFGLSNEDAELNREDYYNLRDELRRKRDYTGYAVTFVVKYGLAAIADAEIIFNGETKETDSTGTAVFYYIAAGTNQEYIVNADGYVSQTINLDVTDSATVNISLVVA